MGSRIDSGVAALGRSRKAGVSDLICLVELEILMSGAKLERRLFLGCVTELGCFRPSGFPDSCAIVRLVLI